MNSGYVDTDMLPGSYPPRKYKHHIVEISGESPLEMLPMRDKQQTTNSEDRATQPMEAGG